MTLTRRFLLLCLAFPLLLAVGGPQLDYPPATVRAPDWNTLFQGLVRVEAEKQPKDTGAGLVIFGSADSIRVLTAAHVVAGATSLKVYFRSDRAVAYTAHLLPGNSDPGELDLAVLEVLKSDQKGRALPGNIPQLAARDRGTLQVTEHVWTVDGGWRIVPNNVTALDHDFDTRKFEYTRGATNDGFSGGAVFDDDGRLVGIHDEGAAGGQYAVAVRVDSAVEVLAALGHNTPNLAGSGGRGNTGILLGGSATAQPAPRAPIAGETRVNPKDGLTYVWIPEGAFTMGCSPGDTECSPDEKPAHAERIANGFWLGQTEVTQAAWKKVNGGANPSYFKGDQLPVDQVDWNQASAYCKAIGGRLPTEKEWEYAARAGTAGSRYGSLDAVAWYSGNSSETTHPVGLKQANAFGLYDMLGNVWEWAADYWAAYPGGRADACIGCKVMRGGSWTVAGLARASARGRNVPSFFSRLTGLRCVGELP